MTKKRRGAAFASNHRLIDRKQEVSRQRLRSSLLFVRSKGRWINKYIDKNTVAGTRRAGAGCLLPSARKDELSGNKVNNGSPTCSSLTQERLRKGRLLPSLFFIQNNTGSICLSLEAVEKMLFLEVFFRPTLSYYLIRARHWLCSGVLGLRHENGGKCVDD